MAQRDSGIYKEEIPKDAVFIIGAGHFGSRAARLLSQKSDAPLFVVDVDENSLSKLERLHATRIRCDGPHFLVKHFHILNPENIIVPAIPVHLAFEWAKCYSEREYQAKQISIPEQIKPYLPHTWWGTDGSLLVSYADFVCPEDCPEPEYCTVSGEKRDRPLYDLLRGLDFLGFRVHVITSRQIAPGLGGYKVKDLTEAAEKLNRLGKWLLGTACKCHGILTGLEIRETTQK